MNNGRFANNHNFQSFQVSAFTNFKFEFMSQVSLANQSRITRSRPLPERVLGRRGDAVPPSMASSSGVRQSTIPPQVSQQLAAPTGVGRTAGSQPASSAGETPKKRPLSEVIQQFRAPRGIVLTEVEKGIIVEGVGTDEVQPRDLGDWAFVEEPRLADEVIDHGDGRTGVNPTNLRVGSMVLFPTQDWPDVWDEEVLDDVNFAICIISSASWATSRGSFSFTTPGHVNDFVPGEAFPVSKEDRLVDFIPPYFVFPSEPTEKFFRKKYGLPPMRPARGGGTKGNRPTTGKHVYGDEGDGDEKATTSVVMDRDNRFSMRIPSTKEKDALKFATVFLRSMTPSKREEILKGKYEYDPDGWTAALLPYETGIQMSSDPEIMSLGGYHRLKRIVAVCDPDKVHRARQSLFKHNNWRWLSIVDYHPKGDTSTLKLSGTSDEARENLCECIKGYLMYLSVIFDSKCKDLWKDLTEWLMLPYDMKRSVWDVEFIRARVEFSLSQFWGEVHSGNSSGVRFPDRCFSSEGDIWLLWKDYESLLFELLNVDPHPHTRFHMEGGEREIIRRTSGVSQPATHPPRSEGAAKFEPTPGQVRTPNLVCAYNLAHLLKAALPDGSQVLPCRGGAGCKYLHSDPAVLTLTQARAVAATGHRLGNGLLDAVNSQPQLFKQ